jgi:hypothetical protein
MTTNTNNRRGAADPVATARDLLARNIMPLPVLPNRKNPIIDEWQKLTITEENLPQYFDSGADFNVGGRMGSKSGGLRDVDLDCLEAILLAPLLLPATDAMYGRASKPASHYLYRSSDEELTASIPFKDENQKMIVELRIGGGGKGSQSVMPGSRHESGEFVRWDAEGEPKWVAFADLKARVIRLAAASLLLRKWPETGRNDIALGVGGFLDRAGWSEAQILRVVEVICLNRGDPDRAAHHATTAASAVAKRKANGETRGFPWLRETFGAEVAKALTKIVGYRPDPEPPPSTDGRPLITITGGTLSVTADKAEQVLIDAGIQFFERSNMLVRPIIKGVDAFHGRKTKTAQLTKVEQVYMRDVLGRVAGWCQLDRRVRAWVAIDPPTDVAATVLGRAGEWKFPSVKGIITAPTLRPDGTVLDRVGFDPATRLLLVDSLEMASIPDHPTKDDARVALELLTDLLNEFPFDGDVAKSVGVSAIITPVVRGAFAVAPLHASDAPVAGSGKSHLLDTASVIVSGQMMPVITAGRTEEETEKRLGSALLASQPLVCLDNMDTVLQGAALCQMITQLRPQVRILGKSELFEAEAGGTTFFANGNNLIVGNDMTRRVICARLDPQMEQPETRQFTGDPIATVLNNRGAYVAACLTICRAYAAAGRPNRKPRLASFEGWSDTVRSALCWLGMADPVASMESIRADDPTRLALETLLTAWRDKIGVGEQHQTSLRDVLELIDVIVHVDQATHQVTYAKPELRSAVLATTTNGRVPDVRAFGNWMRRQRDRRVNGMWFKSKPNSHGPAWWWVEQTEERGSVTDESAF